MLKEKLTPSETHTGEGVSRQQARLVDLAPVANIVRRLDGTITLWSKGAERLYGWSREEALGRLTHELLHTEFPEPLETIIAKLRRGEMWSGELRHITRDGRKVIVESYWLAEVDADGKVTDLLESNIDITERKLLQEHLEELVEQRTVALRQANAELEAFSYSLSHDMRGPLRAISSFTQFALEDCGPELSQTAKEYLEKISDAARRLDRLIQDVLSLSRVSRQQIEMVPVDLQQLLTDIVRQRTELREPAAIVRIEGPLPVVQGHETLLTQVVTNLLANAVKFVASGVHPNIRVRAQTTPGKVKLWIEDNGIGINPQIQQKLFNLFERGGAGSQYAGTGLGLAIVKKAAERMGGTVGLDSQPGVGSRFWVELIPATA